MDAHERAFIVCAWVGAVLMCLAPFVIDSDIGKLLAIAGLAMLTFQAIHHRLLNLILLNSIGMLGYLYAFLI